MGRRCELGSFRTVLDDSGLDRFAHPVQPVAGAEQSMVAPSGVISARCHRIWRGSSGFTLPGSSPLLVIQQALAGTRTERRAAAASDCIPNLTAVRRSVPGAGQPAGVR
jgi:hypothetical protein